MSELTFVDTNVPMYAAGESHPLRHTCIEILQASASHGSACMSSAEVLQEIFHAYLRRDDIGRARTVIASFREALNMSIAPVVPEDVVRAAAMDVSPRLQARDRVHLAVMQRLGITRIISSDRAFDLVPSLTRLDPLRFSDWSGAVFESAT